MMRPPVALLLLASLAAGPLSRAQPGTPTGAAPTAPVTVAPPVATPPAGAWENPLKKLLREGKPVVGMTITTASPDAVVQAARLGFDYVWIEMEHSPITLETAHNMILASQGTGLTPLIRVPVNELWMAKRALDCGALGVIFPFTSTPALAQQAVAACKYPPLGRRGAGLGIPTIRWPAPQGYPDFADQNALVITIIEEKSAVENIDAILDVKGIDVVFIGTNDLSYSFGDRGQQTDRVKAAIAIVLAAAKKRGLPCGRPAALGEIKQFIADGFQFIQGPSELALIGLAGRPYLEAAGKTAPGNANRPLY